MLANNRPRDEIKRDRQTTDKERDMDNPNRIKLTEGATGNNPVTNTVSGGRQWLAAGVNSLVSFVILLINQFFQTAMFATSYFT